MKKYTWEVISAKKNDWLVIILEKIITVDLIIEIIQNAIENDAKIIYIDYCSAIDPTNQGNHWSEFQNVEEIDKLVDKYINDYNITVHFTC